MNTLSSFIQPVGQRYRLLLEYDGACFHGWQLQGSEPTVQGALETALERLCGHPVRVTGAGRTDAGVHAVGQVAHFDTTRPRPSTVLQRALNAMTPRGLVVLEVRPVVPDFHARYDALYREYGYRYLDRPIPPALERHRVWHLPRRLDADKMQEALNLLLGTHDFSAFRAASCQARNPVRTLMRGEVVRQGEELHLVLGANAFLHHMVRNLAGTLARVGQGEAPVAWVAQLLACKDRRLAAPTAPAHPLTLLRVVYAGERGGGFEVA